MQSAGNADPFDVPSGRGLIRSDLDSQLHDAALATFAYRLSFLMGPSASAGRPGRA